MRSKAKDKPCRRCGQDAERGHEPYCEKCHQQVTNHMFNDYQKFERRV